MKRIYCTYFDSRYLAQGIVMLRSLLRHDPAASIQVLAFDPDCERILRATFAASICVTGAAAFHAAHPALAALRDSRSQWAFYATHKPVFIRSILDAAPEGTLLTFIDADMWIFSDPTPVFAELESASIGLSPHRFSKAHQRHAIYGLYNAGWMHWRADSVARRCAAEWELDCFDWCEAKASRGRFMNQAYLNSWPARYPGIAVLRHPGVNLAPWNLERHRLRRNSGRVLVDDQPLISFHYSGLTRHPAGPWHSLYPQPRRFNQVREAIYKPYLDAVESERLRLPDCGAGATDAVRSWTTRPNQTEVYSPSSV